MKLKDFMKIVDNGTKIRFKEKFNINIIGFIRAYDIKETIASQIECSNPKYELIDFEESAVLNVSHNADNITVSIDPIYLMKRLKFKDVRYMIHAEEIAICTKEYTDGVLDFVGKSTDKDCDVFNELYVAYCFPNMIHGNTCIVFILRTEAFRNKIKEGSTTREDPWIDGAEFSLVHGC